MIDLPASAPPTESTARDARLGFSDHGRYPPPREQSLMATMTDIPEEPKKIRARIQRYEKKLQEEKRSFGRYTDGASMRYFPGPLCLLMGDLDCAMASFDWFAKEFPDDTDEPGHVLTWALALYRSGAERKPLSSSAKPCSATATCSRSYSRRTPMISTSARMMNSKPCISMTSRKSSSDSGPTRR